MVERGAVDLSSGAYPAKPSSPSFWKVTVGGYVGGEEYGVGDTLVYSKSLDQFYKIDNTESVTKINGKTGQVVLTASDVGALPAAGNAASASKLASARTINGTPFDGTANIVVADSTKEPVVPAGSVTQFMRGDKTWQDLAAAVRAVVLTGLSTATSTAVAATDTLLAAVGKLQAQVNGLASSKLDAAANAASASKLATARSINGTPFDGTANITVADATKLPLSGGTLSGVVATPLTLERTTTGTFATNINVRFKSSVHDRYFGLNPAGEFCVGASADLTSGANQFWHSGNFDPVDYLPKSGGALSGALQISAAAKSVAIFTAGVERGFLEADTYGIRLRSRDAAGSVAATFTLGADGAASISGALTVGGGLSGNAAGLNNIPAGNLSGTIADARLSGTYSGFTHKMDGANTTFSSPNGGSPNGLARTVHGLAEYRSSAGAQVGAIVFIAPTASTGIMSQLEIQGMLYNQNSLHFTVQGYRGSSTAAWGSLRKVNLGTAAVLVRWGVTADGKACLILGDVDTVWPYPHISIVRALFSHSSVSDAYCTGWTVATVTDLSSYSYVSADVPSVSIESNAASAAKLATARTIGGVPFDGTANISLPGVNAAGTQNTSGNAATATRLASILTTFTGTYPVAVNVNGLVYSHTDITYTGSTGIFSAPTFNATSLAGGGFQGIDADSAAAPSFTWSGDLDTGMWRPAADTLGFTTGGVNRMLISADGLTTPTDLVQYAQEKVQALGAGSGTRTVTVTNGAFLQATANATAATWAFTIAPTAGYATAWTLELTNGGLSAQTFTGVLWAGGKAPTLTASGVDVLVFSKVGAVVRGYLAAKDSR